MNLIVGVVCINFFSETEIKMHWNIQILGICLCTFGEIVRKMAMYTAGM